MKSQTNITAGLIAQSRHPRFQIPGEPAIDTWPLTKAAIESIGKTALVSPRPGNSHGFKTLDDDTRAEQVEDAERVCVQVSQGKWPGWWFEKHDVEPGLSPILKQYLKLSEKNPKACGRWVRTDYPFDLWDKAIEQFALDRGVAWRRPPQHKGVPFVENVLERAKAHAIIGVALDHVFDIKYAFGSARLRHLSNHGDDFTKPGGIANHPEEGAGHGAAAGATANAFERKHEVYPEDDIVQEVVTATKQVCMFRTFEWQHIAHSNLLGWEVGYSV